MFSNEMQMSFQVKQSFGVVFLNLCHVSIHLSVIHRFENVIVSRAVVVTCTCLDEHHHLLCDLTIRALELYWEGGGSMRGTATTICTDSAKLGSVGLYTCAARKFKLYWFRDFRSTDALLSFLYWRKKHHMLNTLFYSILHSQLLWACMGLLKKKIKEYIFL